MSINVITFPSREAREWAAAQVAASKPLPKVEPSEQLDYRRWECGGCEGNTFHLWCDGVVACATCDSLTLGMTATLVLPP